MMQEKRCGATVELTLLSKVIAGSPRKGRRLFGLGENSRDSSDPITNPRRHSRDNELTSYGLPFTLQSKSQ